VKLIINNNIDLFKLIVSPNNKLKLLIKPQEILVLKINNSTAGQAINGLPPDGSTGQILAKKSNADYDAEWINNDQGTVASVTGGSPIMVDNTDPDNPVVQIQQANTIDDGYLSATDWNTFNNKQGAITPAALTRIDDTNVTLTLGGTPNTALLQDTSLTLGWTGTLAPSRGGTGVSNTGTITLGGNLVTSGAFDLTLTLTNNTNVTLPITGTLATLAGVETFTNKTIDADLNTITNIENADIKAGAAIDVNKLAALTASRIVITDGSGFISAADTATYPNLTELSYVKGVSSAIQTQLDSKASSTLASAHIFVGNAGNVATDVAMSGDVTIDNTGVTAISADVIVNADVNANAAIAVSKLAALTANRVIVSDGSGFISASSVTTTTLGYLDATSSIQTQIDTKVTKGGDSIGATLIIGTGDNNVLSLITNGNPTIYAQTDKRIALNHSSPQSTLHMKGDGSNGSNAFIFFGDSFGGGTTPYVSIGENAGTDSDAMEIYGKNGIFQRVGTYGSTSKLCITSAGAVCVNTETAVSGAELTVSGDVDISSTLNVQGIGTFQVSAVFNEFAKFKTASTPSSPANGTEFNLYYKSNKFIIQYNNAGTVRYKYLDLTGTGVTWVQTTVAP